MMGKRRAGCFGQKDHDWFQGDLSRWCLRCWIVRPGRGSAPVEPLPAKPPKTHPGVRGAVIKRDGRWCRYCDIEVSEWFGDGHPQFLTLDHVIPLSRGGMGTADNLVVACSSCNNAKANLLRDEFVASRDRA